MFDTLSVTQLDTLLNQFSIPMFVIERKTPKAEFRIVGLNHALEQLAGLTRTEMLGRSILGMAAAAKDTMEYYQRCVRTQQTIRFSFTFSKEQQQFYWHKTLQYARSPEGYDRVIATAVIVPDHQRDFQDRVTFDDLHYFSSIADLQLENLNSAFDSATAECHLRPIDESRIMRLHATCRTVQRTVNDIKHIVRRAQLRHAPADMKPLLMDLEKEAYSEKTPKIDTLDVLANVCSDLKVHHTG